MSTQTQGFSDPIRCLQQLHICNCRENSSFKGISGIRKFILMLPRSIKAGPIVISVILRSPLTLLFKNHTQSTSICYSFLSKWQSGNISPPSCVYVDTRLSFKIHIYKEAQQNSLSIAYKEGDLVGVFNN